MHKVLYVSNAKREFPQTALEDILTVARRNNSVLNVTGLLLYVDGGFLQVLEGERDVLHQLYGAIARDPRHWDAKLLMDIAAPRNFEHWSMGFQRMSESSADAGIVGITQSAIRGLIKPGSARPVLEVLIATFQKIQGAA